MPVKGWGKGTEVLNAVQDCMIRRLSTEESLQYLGAKGFEMSEAKLRRIKRYIRTSTHDRLNYIAYHEYSASHINHIDTVSSINTILWEVATGKKNITKEQLKAIELIPQNVKILEELYDSNPIVAALDEKIKGGANVPQESK